jgi:hypothetical protein
MRKAIGKKRLEKDGYLRLIHRHIGNGDTGRRAASVILNILLNNGFNSKEASKYRVSTGSCSDKQARAVERTFYGRHYSLDAYDELKAFCYAPERYIEQIPWKAALVFTNATSPEVMAAFDTARLGYNPETREPLTDAELSELNKNF